MRYSSTFLAFLASAAFANAQTWSACNPMEKTTCPKDKALGCTYSYSYATSPGAATDFTFSNTGAIKYENGVAKFRIAKSYDSPTISSNFYIMYGKVDVRMKAAPGAGIVSSVVLQSDTLDEIDWEWLGGRTEEGQSNYFGKGNTTTYDRGAFHAMNHQQFHTYGVEWTENTLTWLIDGAVVRTLNKADVKYDLYPQTPMQIKIGSWAGGDAATNEPGVVQWAGGPTDYTKGPFDMIIESIKVTDYSNGQFYVYSDKSGSAKSIKSEGGAINVGPQNQACGAPEKEATSKTTTSTTTSSSETEKPTTTEKATSTTETEAATTTDAEKETSTTESTFPTLTAPFGNSTTTKVTSAPSKPTSIETPIEDGEETEEPVEEKPVEEGEESPVEVPVEEGEESPVETPVEGGEIISTTTSAGALPESTVVTTTLTMTNTITTCLAVTTTDAAGEVVTTSSTATLTTTSTIQSVVTVPCETTTTTAPGGAIVTTVVPGTYTIPSAVATPTPVVEVPKEIPVPGVETPEVPSVPSVPGVETPELPVKVPEVQVPGVETPELPVEVPEVPEVPEIPEIPEIPEVSVPGVETPVEGEKPVESNSPVEEVPVPAEQPSRTQTYTTVTLTKCATVCGGSTATGVPVVPNNGTAPVFNGTVSTPPPVTEETELETPEEEPQTNVPGTVIEEPLEFDGAGSGLKAGSVVGMVVAGVLGFLVL